MKTRNPDISFFSRTNGRLPHREFGIRQADRFSHLYVIGKTGVGKTTLLETLAAQDIAHHRGIAVIDPHGDLAENLIRRVPAERAHDLVYFNAPDFSQPYGYNPLRGVSPAYVPLAVSGLMEAFKMLWTDAWGVRMEHVLRNALYTATTTDEIPVVAQNHRRAMEAPEDEDTFPIGKTAPPRRMPRPREVSEPGHGGKQHKYLQHLVKKLAEERGIRASVEEIILDGKGRVDVSLVRGDTKVACQISVTTTKDWELGSIEKCLAAGYSEVVLIGTTERHVKTLSKFIEAELDESKRGRVRYLTSEAIVEYLDELGELQPQTEVREQVVRGYKVKVTRQASSTDDNSDRRASIAKVIARSISQQKD